MEATVFFEDGHTENVLFSDYTKNADGNADYLDMHFKFKTESGALYLYTEYLNIIPVLYNPNDGLPPIRYKDHKFYKYKEDAGHYEEEWMVTDEITKIEFYDR